jgi:hypothetical protein
MSNIFAAIWRIQVLLVTLAWQIVMLAWQCVRVAASVTWNWRAIRAWMRAEKSMRDHIANNRRDRLLNPQNYRAN